MKVIHQAPHIPKSKPRFLDAADRMHIKSYNNQRKILIRKLKSMRNYHDYKMQLDND